MRDAMQSPRIIPLIVVAALAGAGGYFLGRRSEPAETGALAGGKSGQTQNHAPVLLPSGRNGMLSDSLAQLRGNEPLTAENATALTFRALEESDPVTRMAATAILLESMTPENALAIRQAFLDITAQTGRRNDTEWALMIRRCGTVLGAAAVKMFADDKNNAALAVEGFAFVDPEGALAACKAADLGESKTVTNAWLTGVCRKDPEKALALALSGKHDGINGGALLNQAIQSAGVVGAREALQRALDAAPEDAVTSEAFPGLYNALADALLHKYITNGTPGEMFKWLEKQKGQAHVPADLLDRVAYETMLKGNPAETLAWIDLMNDGQDGPTVGTARIFDAMVTEPKILSGFDDAQFARVLPLLQKDPLKLEVLAGMTEAANPQRAKQIRAIIPAVPAANGGQ